ncbi:helix-turn-helix domain-containing protein [Desulfovibrio oxyclinae]|uniref:helix-turn-helix domain-containing protein n=1 Tax=Desulfovibrio oxyclinae TaxID=63560 RepID=UPI00036AC6C2|nr:AraC family transcriptional regulator [Desulfovibrio oxyclinae]
MSKSSVKYIRPESLDGFEIRSVVESGHSFPNHTHDVHSVAVMEAGGCYCSSGSYVRKGELAMFNPGFVHSGIIQRSDTRLTYRVLYFDNDLLTDAARQLAKRDALPEFRSVVACDGLAHRELNVLGNTVAAGADRLTLDTALSRACAALLARHCELRPRVPDTQEPLAVRRARDYLNDHLSEKVSLEDLSRVTGLSRYHLLRTFRQCVGIPPHRYHTQIRLEQAKFLLRRGHPIAEAALQSGFSDQSHFANTFRRYTGATPRQYARG